MPVETFECQETAAEEVEQSEEALRLIEELGLDGQKTLLQVETPVRMPYPQATAEQEFVYRVLCPTVSKLSDYRRTPIPLRVLQIASHAMDQFETLQVWDAASSAIKDPVLVGLKPHPQWSWQKEVYLLARWGEELENYGTLLKNALARKRAELTQVAETSMHRAKAFLAGGVSDGDMIRKGHDWQPDFRSET
jgi:hypothetical protein